MAILIAIIAGYDARRERDSRMITGDDIRVAALRGIAEGCSRKTVIRIVLDDELTPALCTAEEERRRRTEGELRIRTGDDEFVVGAVEEVGAGSRCAASCKIQGSIGDDKYIALVHLKAFCAVVVAAVPDTAGIGDDSTIKNLDNVTGNRARVARPTVHDGYTGRSKQRTLAGNRNTIVAAVPQTITDRKRADLGRRLVFERKGAAADAGNV